MTSLYHDGGVSAPPSHEHRIGPVQHGLRAPHIAPSHAGLTRAARHVAPDASLPTGPVVLVGGEELIAGQTLRRLLESANYRVWEADTGRSTLAMMSEEVSVLLIDMAMAEISGRDCLRHVRQHYPDVPVIMISRQGDVPDVVPAMREGAFECFTRSCHPEHLLARVREAVRLASLARENRALQQSVRCPAGDVALAGRSPTMQALRQQIETFARLDSSVLVTGPPGSGKTSAARWIHSHSPRASESLVLIHCGCVPRDLLEVTLFGCAREGHPGAAADRPGAVEVAHGGTLILDEIGDLPIEVQDRLLALLQERVLRRVGSDTPRPVEVRVIATTSHDPTLLCRQGCLREDLLFRLDVLSLRMPALATHLDDLADIAAAMLVRIARRRGCAPPELAPEAIETLQQYTWPGNARELENVLEHASALCRGSTITPKNLTRLHAHPVDPSQGHSGTLGLAGFTLAEIERCAIIETMQACGGNKAQTARRLGVSEKTIYNKIKQYNLRSIG